MVDSRKKSRYCVWVKRKIMSCRKVLDEKVLDEKVLDEKVLDSKGTGLKRYWTQKVLDRLIRYLTKFITGGYQVNE